VGGAAGVGAGAGALCVWAPAGIAQQKRTPLKSEITTLAFKCDPPCKKLSNENGQTD